MSSDRRSLTSAANGRRSKGPVTADGKSRSSRNATRHGLLARFLVLDDESADGFQRSLDHYLTRLQPADPLELEIVEEMVVAAWRLRRSWAIETRMLNDAAAADPSPDPLARLTSAFSTSAASTALPLMHRYETRLHNVFQRGLRSLLLLRSAVPLPPAGQAAPELPPVSEPGPAPCASEPELPNEPNFHSSPPVENSAPAAGQPPRAAHSAGAVTRRPPARHRFRYRRHPHSKHPQQSARRAAS